LCAAAVSLETGRLKTRETIRGGERKKLRREYYTAGDNQNGEGVIAPVLSQKRRRFMSVRGEKKMSSCRWTQGGGNERKRLDKNVQKGRHKCRKKRWAKAVALGKGRGKGTP